MILRAAAALLALALALAAGPAAADSLPPIAIKTSPIDNFLIGRSQQRFGEFEFRGGLVLTSSNREFGGLSGIDFGPDGESLVAISDNGLWFEATAMREGGRLVGLSDTRWGQMLGADGLPLIGKRRADAEGLRLTTWKGKPAAYVSFERRTRVDLYVADPDFASALPRPVRLPKSLRGLTSNKGLETVALAPRASVLGGALVLVAERSLDEAGNHRAWIADGPKAGAFTVRRTDEFDVSDGAFLPDGDLLILERKVTVPFGLAVRIRRLPADTMRPGAVADGPTVLAGDMLNQIDNLEGIAVTRNATGGSRITLVSDDNTSLFQRTLLLEFDWLGPADGRTQ